MNQLKGKTVVFSGKFPGYTRASVKDYAVEQGLKVASGLSAKVDYLVAGDKMGNNKRQQANGLSVPIISFDELQQMLLPQAALNFFPQDLSGDASPKDFLKQLKELDWSKFKAHRDGRQLRNLLQQQEELHGVHESHRFCSKQLKGQLKLLHPYAHDSEITGKQVSPNGQWLATANWMGEEYYHGGILQIWEMETGRVVNQIRVGGGIGWSDYDVIAWNASSDLLGMSYDTNGVGAWAPFEDNNEPQVFAYVTNGWDEPPVWNWSGDGKSIFINYYYFKEDVEDNRDESDRGCWIDVYKRRGNMSHYAKFGYYDDRDKPDYDASQDEKFEFPAPEITVESVTFPHIKEKTGGGEFVDRAPGEMSPMVIKGQDYAKKLKVDPAFPIHQKGEIVWGMAFEEGVIVVPNDYPAEQFLNYSLANKWAWPLQWVDYTRVNHISQLKPQKEFSYLVKTLIKESPKPSKKKKGFPQSEGKTYKDVLEMAVDVYQKQLSQFDDYITEIALTEILRGHPVKALEIVKIINNQHLCHQAADLAMHCYKRKMPEADKFLELALENLPDDNLYLERKTYANLGVCYHEKGDKKEAANYQNKLFNLIHSEENINQDGFWDIFRLLTLTNQVDLLIKEFEENWQEKYFSSFDVRTEFVHMVWYCPLDSMLRLIDVFTKGEDKKLDEHEFINYVAQRIIKEGAYDRLKEVYTGEQYYQGYKERIVARCLQALGKKKSAQAKNLLSYYINEHELTSYKSQWLDYVEIAVENHAALAKAALSKRDWTLRSVSKWAYGVESTYEVYFQLGKLVDQLGLYEQYKREIVDLPEGYKICFLAGLALHADASEKESYLEMAERAIKGFDDSMYGYEALGYLAAAAAQTSKGGSLLKVATEQAIAYDKDLGVERLVTVLARQGAIEMAFKTWMKIPKGTRRHRITGLLGQLCKDENYDAIFDILSLIDVSEINDGGQKVVYVLGAISKSRSGAEYLGIE